jgi:hypothetical protein
MKSIRSALLVALFPLSSIQAQVAPPTLSGEHLVGVPQVTTNCNPDATSTVTFSASGTAAGPYPGTFTEVGSATIGPQTVSPGGGQSIGPLLSFDAVFTIQSPVGTVTGTKTLTIPIPAGEVAIGQCNTFGDVELEDVIAFFTVRYEAQISTGEGSFADRGFVQDVSVQRINEPGGIVFQSFLEDFLSELTEVEPLASPGQATGGGQIDEDVTFGFTAKSDQKGVKARCTVIDRTAGTMVKCLDGNTYTQAGTHATFSGNALVDGVETTYRIVVDDEAEPGAGADTFTITTGTGYSASGPLTQGNIQVHH